MTMCPKLLFVPQILLSVFILVSSQARAVEKSNLSTSDPTHVNEHCSSNVKVLGVARTLEIDTKNGPAIGGYKNKNEELLHDKEVILTFDDGPSRKYTEVILNALDAYCTKATFFVIGHLALTERAILKDIDHRGHTIAAHTWSHKRLDKIGSKKAKDEIELGFSAIEKALEKPVTPFFRFPYLAENNEIRNYLSVRNVANVRINIDSRDFLTRNPSVVRKNVMTQLNKEGKGIILFHDIHASSASAIRTILKDLKDNNYKVVHIIPKEPIQTFAKYNAIAQKEGLKAGGGSSDVILEPVYDIQSEKKVEEKATLAETGSEMSSKSKEQKRNWDQEPFLTRKPLRRKEEDGWAVSPLKLPQ